MRRIQRLAQSIIVFGCMCAGQSFAAGAPISKAQENADSPALRFTRAQNLKFDGEPIAALRELDSLRNDFPLDVDYVLARAQLLVQLRRDSDALDDLATATDLAPDYEEVWKLRFSVLARLPNHDAAGAREALQAEAAERFPDALWWRMLSNKSATSWILLVGAGHETLSNGQPSWNSQFAELQLKKSVATQFRARVARDQRFAGSDIVLGIGAEHAWESGWFAGADLAIASSPRFQPDLGYAGHLGKVLGDGWVLDVRFRRREYPTTSVGSVTTIVEKYVSNFRFAYGLGVSRLQGAGSLPNHTVTANWFYRERLSVGLTLNTGKEAESIGNGRVLETDVRGVSLSGRGEISDRLGLHWWIGVHDQGDFYRRRFLGMAISYRL